MSLEDGTRVLDLCFSVWSRLTTAPRAEAWHVNVVRRLPKACASWRSADPDRRALRGAHGRGLSRTLAPMPPAQAQPLGPVAFSTLSTLASDRAHNPCWKVAAPIPMPGNTPLTAASLDTSYRKACDPLAFCQNSRVDILDICHTRPNPGVAGRSVSPRPRGPMAVGTHCCSARSRGSRP